MIELKIIIGCLIGAVVGLVVIVRGNDKRISKLEKNGR